jgi:predicted Zn-dependent protease
MEEPTASEISSAVEEALAVTTIDKIENAAAVEEEVHDPYFYTNQQDLFTSEIFKIELHNLPKFFGLGVCKNTLLLKGRIFK